MIVVQVGEVDPTSPAELQASLAMLVRANMVYLAAHPETPALYRAGVVYKRERRAPWGLRTVETFRQIPAVLRAGAGDCEDLASWRAAELRIRGERARALAVRSNTPGVRWHIIVQRGDGSREDPSALLGMGR